LNVWFKLGFAAFYLGAFLIWIKGSINPRHLAPWVLVFGLTSSGLFVFERILKTQIGRNLKRPFLMSVLIILFIQTVIESGVKSKLIFGSAQNWLFLQDSPEVKYKKEEILPDEKISVPLNDKRSWYIPLPQARQTPIYAKGTISSGFEANIPADSISTPF
jgi:hypothetical protein